jgi:hypothetical protein
MKRGRFCHPEPRRGDRDLGRSADLTERIGYTNVWVRR